MSEQPSITWTPEELAEFDLLTWMVSSRDQTDRIRGRLDMDKFVEKHGKEKCDAMFAHLTKSEKLE